MTKTMPLMDSKSSASTFSLRRVALPTDPLLRQLQTDEDEDDTQFSVYKSPCTIEVSNDLFTAAEYDEMEICEQTFYGKDCNIVEDETTTPFEVMSNRGDDSSIHQLNVTFDYELHYDPDANIKRALASLEATMVQHLAFATRLDDCSDKEGRGKERLRRLQRRRNLQQGNKEEGSGSSAIFTDTELSRIQAISSEPIDIQDKDWGAYLWLTAAGLQLSYAVF